MAMPEKCLTTTCNAKEAASCRGLCMRCYSGAKRLVESGQTTWDQLAAMQLVKQELSEFEKRFAAVKAAPIHETY